MLWSDFMVFTADAWAVRRTSISYFVTSAIAFIALWLIAITSLCTDYCSYGLFYLFWGGVVKMDFFNGLILFLIDRRVKRFFLILTAVIFRFHIILFLAWRHFLLRQEFMIIMTPFLHNFFSYIQLKGFKGRHYEL